MVRLNFYSSFASASALILFLALSTIPSAAFGDRSKAKVAQRPEESYEANVTPGDFLLDLQLEVAASTGSYFQPTSLAPDLWYGMSESLSLGVVHSGLGQTGFWGSTGNGFCLSGSSKGCEATYGGGGILARYSLFSIASSNPIGFALEGGILNRRISPFRVAAKVGLVSVFQFGRFGGSFAPSLRIGFFNRGLANPNELFLPVSLRYYFSRRWQVGVQAGYAKILSHVPPQTRSSRIPVSLGVDATLNDRVVIHLVLSAPALTQNNSARTVTLATSLSF